MAKKPIKQSSKKPAKKRRPKKAASKEVVSSRAARGTRKRTAKPDVLPSRFATTIFCDDIRKEQGNKMTYVGCYRSNILVPTIPMVLPKFALVVTIQTPKDDPIKSLRIIVQFDDSKDPLVEADVDPEAFEQVQDEQVLANEKMAVFNAIIHLVTSPLVINAHDFLRVRVETERETIRAGGLMFQEAKEGSQKA